MFLLINTKETSSTNKRLVYHLTNIDNKDNYLNGIVDGDVVELTLTELHNNTVHKFVGSYNRFMPKVPYSFTLVDAIGISNVTTLKSAIDFKLTGSKVVKYSDPNRPTDRHYIAVDGKHGKELKETHVFRPDKVSNDNNLKREVVYTTPTGQKVTVREPVNLNRLEGVVNDVLVAPSYDVLDDIDYILPAGGAIVPIINTDQLLTKSYLRKKLNELVTIGRLEDTFKDVIQQKLEEFETMVIKKSNNVLEHRLGSLLSRDDLFKLVKVIEKNVIKRLEAKNNPGLEKELIEGMLDDIDNLPYDRTPSGNHPQGLLPNEALIRMLDHRAIHKHGCLSKPDKAIVPLGRPHPHLINPKHPSDWGTLLEGGKLPSEKVEDMIHGSWSSLLDKDDGGVLPDLYTIATDDISSAVNGDGGVVDINPAALPDEPIETTNENNVSQPELDGDGGIVS